MGVLDNKCPTCGSTITFNLENQIWDCAYCSSKFTLEAMQQINNASTKESNMNAQFLSGDIIRDLDLYCCKNCGAQIMALQTTTPTFCVYCGSTAILKERILNGKAPNYIIPFKTTKEDVINGFKKIIKGKLLMPKIFKELSNVDKISGVYIPFWAYDLEANGEVEFEASDAKYWNDSKYKYKKVDKYLIRKSGHFDFLKVLVEASTRFPDDLMDLLEPFDYNELTSYNHAYLAGFFAEKYDVDEYEVLKILMDKTNDTAVELMKNTVRYSEQKVINNEIRVSSKHIHYIMLPVWMLNIKYKGKTYTFAMNGQTGKVVGNVPIGLKETLIWSVIFFVILFVIGLIFARFII